MQWSFCYVRGTFLALVLGHHFDSCHQESSLFEPALGRVGFQPEVTPSVAVQNAATTPVSLLAASANAGRGGAVSCVERPAK